MDISQSIDNIMDGKYYQRGSIEKDGNRQINSATIIQDEDITISRTSCKNNASEQHIIEGNIGEQKTYLDNSTGAKCYQIKREAEYRQDGMVS